MKARRFFGLSLLTIALSLNVSAATVFNTNLFTPLGLGGTFTAVSLTGLTTPSQTAFAGVGYTVSFANLASDQGVVQGNYPLPSPFAFIHAVPVAGVIGGTTPVYLTGNFNSPLTTDVNNSGNYFSTGLFGVITITFAQPVYSAALLWGSVDDTNTLTLNDALNTVITGAQIQGATPGFAGDGSQAAGGSAWVRINSDTPFTTITATSGNVSFEFTAVIAAVPEPNTFFLSGSIFAIGALIWLRRGKTLRLSTHGSN